METTGLSELENLSFEWKAPIPGYLTTLCCATGTCDIYIRASKNKVSKTHLISTNFDHRDAEAIKMTFGALR